MNGPSRLAVGAVLGGLALAATTGCSTATRLLSALGGVIAPWVVDPIFKAGPEAVLLFLSDPHGAFHANDALVSLLDAEPRPSAFVLAGDVVDGEFGEVGWRFRWDTAFAPVRSVAPWYAASGNHDVETAEGRAAFRRRFGELPRQVRVGTVDLFLLPWRDDADDAAWLNERVASSTARWCILVRHKPLWSVKDGGADDTAAIARMRPALGRIALVLSGHEHVRATLERKIGDHPIRQVIEVSGPKHYACEVDPEPDPTCTEGESGYTRIVVYPDRIRLDRVTVTR